MTVCKICNNSSDNKSYVVREMMYGFKDEFDYFVCGKCGCLQIEQIPDDLSKYYPENYWHFQEAIVDYSDDNAWLSFIRHQRARYWLFYGRNIVGKLLSTGHVQPRYFGWLRRCGLNFDSEILDLGCGIGHRLLELRKDGFSKLTGIDPFVKDNIVYGNGVKVLKRRIHEMDGQFDFIMLHHSFEHMPDPKHVIRKLYSLLKPNRYILVRVPLASSYAWRKYRVNWAQLDAPRHLFLHTLKSIRILAEDAGFHISDVIFDSDAFQFWGSEQYRKNIPLYDKRSYEVNTESSIFSEEQIQFFRKHAQKLNENKEGDQVCIYLYKA